MSSPSPSDSISSAVQFPAPASKAPKPKHQQQQKGSKFSSSGPIGPAIPGTEHHTKAVIGTSDDAAVSKLSACQLGYFSDPFLKYFVPHGSRRPPLINRGYFSRVAAVWQILYEFCTSNPNQKKQIFSLGAGSDTNYFKLKSLGVAPFKYYEVDFPEAMKKKAAIIEKHPELLSLATTRSEHHAHSVAYTPGQLQYPDYLLLGADLRDLSGLESQLAQLDFDYSLPTLFLSECVLIYMRPEDSLPVIEWSARKFTGGSLLVSYEQILPNDPFGQTMINNLKTRGCELLGYEKYPDLAAHRDRYLSAGYERYSGWDMNEIYRCFINPNEVARIEKLELFDEFEEWHMIQAHYHISMAVKEANGESSPKWTKIGLIGREKTPLKPNHQPTHQLSHSSAAPCPALDPTVQHFYPKIDVHQAPINPLIEANAASPDPAILINKERVES